MLLVYPVELYPIPRFLLSYVRGYITAVCSCCLSLYVILKRSPISELILEYCYWHAREGVGEYPKESA